MDASTPWRSQLLEPKQTPRPRPPAFALRNRRPSAKGEWKAEVAVPIAPPPYRKDVDANVVTAARSLGLEVSETGGTSDVEGEGEVPEGQRESRDEMKKRLLALEKRLGEREKGKFCLRLVSSVLLTHFRAITGGADWTVSAVYQRVTSFST